MRLSLSRSPPGWLQQADQQPAAFPPATGNSPARRQNRLGYRIAGSATGLTGMSGDDWAVRPSRLAPS
jgi:hypothetical protein